MKYSTLPEAETHNHPIMLPGRFPLQKPAACQLISRHTVSAGAARHWPALEQWQEQAGVLRMTELAGQAQVQVMSCTEEEPLFFGDMRQYTPQTCSFGDYLAACNPSSRANADESMSAATALDQAYLAQASLDQGQPLAALRQDFDIPEAIRHVEVNHTNLWMSIR